MVLLRAHKNIIISFAFLLSVVVVVCRSMGQGHPYCTIYAGGMYAFGPERFYTDVQHLCAQMHIYEKLSYGFANGAKYRTTALVSCFFVLFI